MANGAPLPKSRHLDLADAAAFWSQFPVTFYFETPFEPDTGKGDRVAGTLLDYREEGSPKDPIPEIRLLTKDGRTFKVTAHQERLKAELVKALPAKGDWVRITYTGEAERAAPGMSKSKLFLVEVKRLERDAPPSPNRPDATSGEVLENDKGTGANAKKGGP